MQTHRYSFFGQKTAMILQSGDWADPFLFLTFIKKRDGGNWEKLAEGKSVKLSLPEIAALRSVVAGEKPEWKTFHKSSGAGTPISARLESNKEGTTVLINAGDYLRPINYPETVIFEKLLGHIFEEKITYATGNAKPVPEESSPEEPAVEATQEPAPAPPVVEVEEQPSQVPPKPTLTPSDADLTMAESLAKYHLPPLPQRLPSGVFPMTGRLKSVRTVNGVTTLFLKLASGTVEEVPTVDIVGAGVHDSIVDLVIKTIPSPKAPEASPANPSQVNNPKAKHAAKRGKPSKTAEVPPTTPKTNETVATQVEPTAIRAASVKKVTERALLVTNAGGTELWIPKSAIAGDVPAPAAPQDSAWQFAVKDWFAQKVDFQNWVKST